MLLLLLADLNTAVAAAEASAEEAAGSVASIPALISGKLNTVGTNPASGLLANIGAVSLVNLALSTGAGLVGWIGTGTGAVLRTLLAKLRGWPDVKDFGAVGDGVADDTAAFVAAAAANIGKRIFVPAGTYNVTAMNFPLATKFYGAGAQVSIIKKTANGDFGTIGDAACIEALRIDLNAPTYTGKGLTVNGGNQITRDFEIINGDDACIYFPFGSGSRWHSENVRAYRTASTGGAGLYAVVFEDTVQAAGLTTWVNFKSDGKESFDFGGGNNCQVTNSALFDCKWSVNSRDIALTGNRMAGTVPYVLKGSGSIIGGAIAPQTTIDPGATFNVSPGYSNSDIIDNSGGTSIVNSAQIDTYVPVMSAGGVPITLGDGTLIGRFSRAGKLVFCKIRFIPGAGTVIPAGAITITLPVPTSADLRSVCGIAEIQSSGGTLYMGYTRINNAATSVQLFRDTSGAVTNASPGAMGVGGNIHVSVTYET